MNSKICSKTKTFAAAILCLECKITVCVFKVLAHLKNFKLISFEQIKNFQRLMVLKILLEKTTTANLLMLSFGILIFSRLRKGFSHSFSF